MVRRFSILRQAPLTTASGLFPCLLSPGFRGSPGPVSVLRMRARFPQRNECQYAIDSKGERAGARQTFAPSPPERPVSTCLAFDLSHRTVLLSAVLHTGGCKENYLSISPCNKSVWAQRAAASTRFIECHRSCMQAVRCYSILPLRSVEITVADFISSLRPIQICGRLLHVAQEMVRFAYRNSCVGHILSEVKATEASAAAGANSSW